MRAEKQLLLDEIVEKISNCSGFVITRYRNFTSTRAREFRDWMAGADAEFEVVKKRVFIKAAEAAGISIEKGFEGHVGILFAKEDTLRAIKKAVAFNEENEESIALLGGLFEGQMCGSDEILALSRLPSQKELRAQFLGLLEAPMGQTIGAMQSLLSSILYCIENKCKQESGAHS